MPANHEKLLRDGMPKLDPDQSPYSLSERWGAGVAHSSLLLIGLPLTIILLPVPFSLAPCPVVSYLIARYFRRKMLVWGADQSIQASAIQVLIVLIAGFAVLTNLPHRIDLALGTAGFLLFLYTLWAALDTLLGYDFHYILIGNAVRRVSEANLKRRERRRRWSRRTEG